MRNVVMLALTLVGCSAPAPSLPPTPGGIFVAFERHFQDFRGWHRIKLAEGGPQGITHLAGKRSEYVNMRPSVGMNRFPVGTMIVKEIEAGAPHGHQIFAMAKRGGGYNGRGAKGWEWFELRERPSGELGIVWRGVNAPSGEAYGGDPLGGCNGCHETSASNDFVMAEALVLAGR